MSALLSSHGVLLTDAHLLLADDESLPGDGALIVSLARWQAESTALLGRAAPVAVKLPNAIDVLSLDDKVLARPLLVLDFPSFADGRAYSQARRLRDRCGYGGLLRATGAAVVIDQLVMLLRTGFDQIQLRADQPQALAVAELLRLRQPWYQPDALQNRFVTLLRQG